MTGFASPAKQQRLRALATQDGVIAALAVDQRKSLRKMIAAAAGKPLEEIPDSQLMEFKAAVTAELTGHCSAILLDPEYGRTAMGSRAPGCGLIATYESDGFENPRPHRMLALMPEFSVRRLRDLGAAAVKILLSYAPEDEPANDAKRAMVERIGAECAALDMPFFLEPVYYDPAGADPRSLAYAQAKPRQVVRIMEVFSRPEYAVDVLKVEFPVTAAFVQGSGVYCGQAAYSLEEALEWYRAADAAARLPYIYLSAGVSIGEFLVSLELAAQSGARFSGVLCGRANWQEGVAEYVRGGAGALSSWLARDGVRNISAVNARLQAATPWTAWLEAPAT
jgi:tagatose 1,6-diphosphate aldolase